MARIHLQILRGALRHKAVTCPVKSVSSHLILLVILVRKAVEVCLFRHCLMERGVKYPHHRHIGHQLSAGIDSDQIRRIVKRCQIIALFHCRQNFRRQKGGRRKLLSAVHHAVSDCVDLGKTSDGACLIIDQGFEYHLDCLLMSGHIRLCDLLVQPALLVYKSPVNPDALAQPLCENALALRINQLIL